MKKNYLLLLFLLFSMQYITAQSPTVTTNTTTMANIGAVRATLSGNVTAGAPLTAKGIVWSTASTTTTPTLGNNVVTNSSTATETYSDIVTGLPPGTLIYYRAYATNNDGTSYGDALSFTTNAPLSATQTQTNVTCNGGSNAAASATVSGGKSPYIYSWSPSGQTNSMATGLAAGQYTLTITDAESTILTKIYDITQPAAAPVNFTTQPTNKSICQAGSTTFTAEATNATSYQWQVNKGDGNGFGNVTNGGVYNTATTSTLTITGATALMSGYVYRLRADSLCSGYVYSNNASLQVANIIIDVLALSHTACYGHTTGYALVEASGGTAPYTYSWFPSGGNAESASGLTAGTYVVTVTDANSCSATQTIVINGPTEAVSGTVSKTNVSCNGGGNGTATVTASGGTPGYTYLWSNGQTGPTATGLNASTTYDVTIKDIRNCSFTITGITVTQPAAALSATSSTTPVSCNGGGNGTATVNPSGGTVGYTYYWNNGQTTRTATGLSAGTYNVEVTDANGCSITLNNIQVTQPVAPLSASTAPVNVSCNGQSNGSITVTPSGGTGPYTYLWNNTQTGQTATNLTAGLYNVVVTDFNSCSILIENILVTQPSAILSNPTQSNVNCVNGTDGRAEVAPTGGAGDYSYLWSPSGETTSSISGLIAGNYSVTITDLNGCEKMEYFTISQPTAIVLTQGTSNNVSCKGGANGSVSVLASGGAGFYTYSWSPNGETTSTITGLTPGDYTVTVTDVNSCQAIQTYTVSEPAAALTVADQSQTNILCSGSPTGSASVVATGGTGTYTYSWSPSGGTASTAVGLTAGTYTVTITDANACQATATFTITQPATPLMANAVSSLDIACYGDATGSASVVATGGTGAYTYSWAPSGGTAATATGLIAGTYTVTVTDENLCTATETFTITQPNAPLSATSSSTMVSCFGGSNGTAGVAVTGGTLPYSYSWAPLGGTGSSIAGRPAGDYTVTITDGNNCTLQTTVTIATPAQFSATVDKTDVSCFLGGNGSATITPSGATAPFTYTWTPYGGSNAYATGLAAGNYNVIVEDGNGCVYNVEVEINQPDELTAASSQVNVTCLGQNNGEATVTPSGGTAPYSYSWSPYGGTAATATGLAPGMYNVEITDARGCFITRTFTILPGTDNQPPVPNVSTLPNVIGYCSISLSEITIPTAVDNCVGTIVAGTVSSLNFNAPGTYTVTWVYDDGNGNYTVQNQTFIVLDSPLDQVTFTDAILPYNGNIQTLEVANLPTNAVVSYSIVPATTSPNGALNAGTYTVTAIVTSGVNAPNCAPVTLTAELKIMPDILPPVPSVSSLPNVISYCSISPSEVEIPTAVDDVAGTIAATTVSSLNFNAPGTYTVTWVYDDGNGNDTEQDQTFIVLDSPLNEVTLTDVTLTYNGNIQTLDVANLPADAQVSYSIMPATTSPNGALNAGTYSVTAFVTPGVNAPNCAPVILTAALTIEKAAQQITFEALPKKSLGANNNFSLNASASSNLPIVYSYTFDSPEAPATVSSTGEVSLVKSGEILITANQPGDDNYLPAQAISQLLVVLNQDIEVQKITIGGQTFDNPEKVITQLLSCGDTNPSVSIVNQSNAVITPSANFTIATPKPGIYNQDVTIASEDGTTSASFLIRVEKPFNFFDIVEQKFDNVLLVNNNPQTNGGYEFVAYEWYKDGQLIGTGQYYSAGDTFGSSLDSNSSYNVKMTTKDGTVLQTCSSEVSFNNSLQAKLYPNPIEKGKAITVEADFPSSELENMQISIYSLTGKLVKVVKSSLVKTEIQLPESGSNIYLVVLDTPNIKKSFKVIVK